MKLPYTYLGYVIDLDNHGSFSVAGRDGSLITTVSTFTAAKEKVDRIKAAENAMSKRKLALPVVSLDGEKAVITGIHTTQLRVLTKPLLWDTRYPIYADAPIVRALIAEYNRLDATIKAIRKTLNAANIERHRYRKGIGMDDMLDNLAAEHTEATAAAVAMPSTGLRPPRGSRERRPMANPSFAIQMQSYSRFSYRARMWRERCLAAIAAGNALEAMSCYRDYCAWSADAAAESRAARVAMGIEVTRIVEGEYHAYVISAAQEISS